MRRLIACYFCRPDEWPGRPWERMARVLENSARLSCPGWSIEVSELEPRPKENPRAPAYHANTQKLDHWAQAVATAAEGDELLLIDADTWIERSLDDVWAQPFDMAITKRQPASRAFPMNFPINGGVVFLRVSAKVKDFVARWRLENHLMLNNLEYHQTWQRRYGGINQSALGMLLETGAAADLRLVELPCSEWNCEDSSWVHFGSQTRIVHAKSALRRAILKIGHSTPECRPLAKLWARFEQEAGRPQEATP